MTTCDTGIIINIYYLRWYRLIIGAGLTMVTLPAVAGPPFVTDDPEPVDEGHFEINIASVGQVQQIGTTSPAPMVDANWGAAADLQLHAGFGLAFADIEGHFTTGIGDTELGFKYRFVHQDADGWRPEIAFFPIAVLPTGDASRSLGTGHLQTLLPIWVEKDWGSWTTYGGGGFQENHHRSDRNYWLVGWTLLRQVSHDLQFGGEIYHQTASTAGQPVTTAFNLGGTWDLSETGHILFSAGRGLEHAAINDRFSFYLGYRITM